MTYKQQRDKIFYRHGLELHHLRQIIRQPSGEPLLVDKWTLACNISIHLLCLWAPGVQCLLSFCSVFGLHHQMSASLAATMKYVHQLVSNFVCLLFDIEY